MSPFSVLQFDHVAYQWPSNPMLLGPIDATLPPGRLVGLIGPNGAGKSTLLKLVAALLKPVTGTITVNGRAVAAMKASERAQYLAFVPQTLDTSFDLTVQEVVELGRLNQLSWKDRFLFSQTMSNETIREVMEKTEVAPLAERSFATLSGGEAKRVLLAAALVQQSPLLLLDEPTAHLDPGHALKFLDLVKQLVREDSQTVLMAYHDLTTVGLYADEIWVLDQGQLVAQGTPEEILRSPLIEEIYRIPLIALDHPRTKKPMLIFP